MGFTGTSSTRGVPSGDLVTRRLQPAHLSLFLGIVVAEMGAAAFLAVDGGAGDDLRDGQQVVQIERGVPAVVVFAIAGDAGFGGAGFQFLDARRGRAPFLLRGARCRPGPASCLQFVLDGVGILAGGAALEGF